MSWRNWRTHRKTAARRSVSSRRSAPKVRKSTRGGGWFRVNDSLGISKEAKQFIEKKLNLGFDTSKLKEFNINKATWGTRNRLGLCRTTRTPMGSSSKIRVDIPQNTQNMHIPHQGRGKRGRVVRNKDEAAVMVALHEAQHIKHHHGQVPTKQRDWEPEADDVGFAALDEYRQQQATKPTKKRKKKF